MSPLDRSTLGPELEPADPPVGRPDRTFCKSDNRILAEESPAGLAAEVEEVVVVVVVVVVLDPPVVEVALLMEKGM